MDKALELILQLLVEDGVIIAMAVFVLAEIIKKSIPQIKNEHIPLIGGVVGITLGLFIPNLFPEADVITKSIYGLALGWSATGGYETIRGLLKKGENENE